MHKPINDPLSGWNDPQPWYSTTTGRTEPPRRRNVAGIVGRVAAAIGWVALAYVFVLVVAACSVTVEPAGGDTTPAPEPVEHSTGYSHDYKASLLRDLARNDDNLCWLYDQNGAESVARILNRADTDVEFKKFEVRTVLSEECTK